MRIRTIKPEWLEDDRLVACSDAARVLSVALITMADDAGRGRLGLTTAARVWPTKPNKLQSVILELSDWFVALYEVRGQRYYQIRNWDKHQRINRPTESKLPAFSEDAVIDHGSLTEDSLIDHGSFTEDSPREGKGREGKGKDHDQSDPARPDSVVVVFECWKQNHSKTDRPQLTNDRRKLIKARLNEGYTTDVLCAAIRGTLNDRFMMGENDRGRPYRGLDNILRNGERVEKLAALDGRKPPPTGPVQSGDWSDVAPLEPSDCNPDQINLKIPRRP